MSFVALTKLSLYNLVALLILNYPKDLRTTFTLDSFWVAFSQSNYENNKTHEIGLNLVHITLSFVAFIYILGITGKVNTVITINVVHSIIIVYVYVFSAVYITTLWILQRDCINITCSNVHMAP